MEKNDFWQEITQYYQLWNEVTQLYFKWAKQQGTTYNTILTICSLHSEQGHCTQKMICDKWNLPKQTVNTILKEFDRKGYVTFSYLSSDKRNKVISLTEKGLAYAEEITSALYRQDFHVVEKMGVERIASLNENLALYAKYYREAGQKNR